MNQVYAAGGVQLWERNRRRTEFFTWDVLVERAATAYFVEMNLRIGDIMQRYKELSRQLEQSATARVLTALLK